MRAAIHPPQLSPEQEAAGWAVMEALQTAQECGDAFAKIEAAGNLLDWQLSIGLLSREELRAMLAPQLLNVVGALDSFPEGRRCLQMMRTEAMELLNGADYRENAGAALLLVTMDAVQRPRHYAEQAKRNKESKRGWRDELVRMQDSAEDVAPLLWGRAYVIEEGADADPQAAEFQEALARVRSLHHSAGVLLRLMGYQPAPENAFMRQAAKEACE